MKHILLKARFLTAACVLIICFALPIIAEARPFGGPPTPRIGHIATKHMHHKKVALHHMARRDLHARKHRASIGHISRKHHSRPPRPRRPR